MKTDGPFVHEELDVWKCPAAEPVSNNSDNVWQKWRCRSHLEPLGGHVVFSHVLFVALKSEGFRLKTPFMLSSNQTDWSSFTDHDVSSADELQSGLEDQDVGDVDEVAGVVGQQPQVDVLWGLVGKRPADGDQPHVPVPRRHNEEEPDDVDQICGGGK